MRVVPFLSTTEYDLVTIHRDPDGLAGINGPDLRNAAFGTVSIDSSGDFVTQTEFTGGGTTGPILLSDIARISLVRRGRDILMSLSYDQSSCRLVLWIITAAPL